MDSPQLLSARRVFEGRVFNVRVDELRYEDGAQHRIDVVEHGPSFAIVALRAPDELVLVRQYRHAAREVLWELPAGSSQPKEDPVEGALRELREETGYRAGRIRPIGSTWMTPGFCDEIMHFFCAESLVPGEPEFDEDERIEIGTFSSEAAWRLVAGGVADAKTLLALFWMQGRRSKFGTDFGR